MELKQRSIQMNQVRKYTFEYQMSMNASPHRDLFALILPYIVGFLTVSIYKKIISYMAKFMRVIFQF